MDIEKAFAGKRNLFITGAAGTGKSYWLKQYIEKHENTIICAPTGIAALNVGGDTMHRVFHIPVPTYESPSFAKNKKGALTTAMLKPIAQADTIIIDEISMARNDVFAFAIKVIRKAEKLKGSKIRIIVCGDFSQLPPVVKKNEVSLMKKFGFDPSGYAFTTSEWKSCNFQVVELTKVIRQENQEFVSELNRIRIGDHSHLYYWDEFVKTVYSYENSVVICGTNAEAERINKEYLNNLPGDLKVLQSIKEGRCTAGYVDDLILIKEGAKVIFTANDIILGKYQNGTFGTVKHIDTDYVSVLVNNEYLTIRPKDYKIYSYTCKNGVLEKKELGKITQYPFKVGKAITIHKSQGQTFDNVIISPEIFAQGQLYVALSRVRGPEGLVLLKQLEENFLIIDKTVEEFYQNGYVWTKTIKKPVKKTVSKTAKKVPAKTTRQVVKKPRKNKTNVNTKVKAKTKKLQNRPRG
jgi:ATP-dependent exoDNAse (exonuclease V) alpha subunit